MQRRFRTTLDYAPELPEGFEWVQAKELTEDDMIVLETPHTMDLWAHTAASNGVQYNTLSAVEHVGFFQDYVTVILSNNGTGKTEIECLFDNEYLIVLDDEDMFPATSEEGKAEDTEYEDKFDL